MESNESNATPASPPGGAVRTVSWGTILSAVIWFAAVVAAMIVVINYSNAPGAVGAVPLHWPAESKIAPDGTRPTLLMFAHPQCPCTRSTVGELELLMARCQGRVNAHVMFIRLEGTAEEWTRTELWRKASAIPGVLVHADEQGAEARRFHSETSGQTLLYDSKGDLLFRGGITISRGHSGDNPGRAAVMAFLEHKISNQVTTPVFGCPLFDGGCASESSLCNH